MTCMRVQATLTTCEEIKPGELFSTAGPHYWEHMGNEGRSSIGEVVYIRTHSAIPTEDVGRPIYRITILDPPDPCHVCCPPPPFRCPCDVFCSGHSQCYR